MSVLLVISNFGGENLLKNPGFEDWEGGLPCYWDADEGIKVTQDSGRVLQGSYSAKITLYSQEPKETDFLSHKISVTPGVDYTFTIHIFDNDPAGRARLVILWYEGKNYYGKYSSDKPNWQTLSATRTAPANAESCQVGLRFYTTKNWDGDAVFFVDSASLTSSLKVSKVMHQPTNPDKENVIVRAKIASNYAITSDTLYYAVNDSSKWYFVTHDSISNGIYYYHIPPQEINDTVWYYVSARDEVPCSAKSSTFSYLVGKLPIIINEVLYDSEGQDAGCFIELKGEPGLKLDGYTIVGVNGAKDALYNEIVLDGYSIPADGYFVIAQDESVENGDLITSDADMQNGPDNLQLRKDGIVIDALGYGSFADAFFRGEWEPVQDVSPGHSIGRSPDGKDTDNNSVDFRELRSPTPGAANPTGIKKDYKKHGEINSLHIFPNVGKNSFDILLSLKYPQVVEIKLYDSSGRFMQKLLSEKKEKGIYHIDYKPDLPAGVYFLKANINSQTLLSKFIVVK